jgi:molybdate transport system substrate-binding protein
MPHPLKNPYGSLRAVQAKAEAPGLQIVSIPDELAVGADYGLTVMASSRLEAARFALFVLSTAGQEILKRHGFTPVTLP